MARQIICDVCGKATPELAYKLLLVPPTKHGRAMHTSYKAHADVGICCQGRITKVINFKSRRTRKEYNEERKKRSGVAKVLEQTK